MHRKCHPQGVRATLTRERHPENTPFDHHNSDARFKPVGTRPANRLSGCEQNYPDGSVHRATGDRYAASETEFVFLGKTQKNLTEGNCLLHPMGNSHFP
jgi:hypothetical protein